MQKRDLLAPGPTQISPEVLLKMAEPIIHRRNPMFEIVIEEVRENLKYVFGTKNEVLIFASSGTGAMEGAVTNMLSPGDKARVFRIATLGYAEKFDVITAISAMEVTLRDLGYAFTIGAGISKAADVMKDM